MEWRFWKQWPQLDRPISADQPAFLARCSSSVRGVLSAHMPRLVLHLALGPTSPILGTIRTYVARLSVREQWLVGGGVLTTGILLGYLLVIEPVWEAQERGRARLAAKERELAEVLALQRTYQTLQHTARRTQVKHDPRFSPFAFLENLMSQTIGRDKVSAISPAQQETQGGLKRETIEVQLQGVSLRQLVELLHKINTANVTLQTTRLSIKKRYKDAYSFDVFLTTLALSAE